MPGAVTNEIIVGFSASLCVGFIRKSNDVQRSDGSWRIDRLKRLIWFSDLLGEFGEGQSVPDGDPQAFLAPVCAIYEQRQSMSDTAREKALGTRRFCSKESFVRMLWSDDA